MVTKIISRNKALGLMQMTKGRFFTVTFTKKDGTDREMTCTYYKDQQMINLGYVIVNDIALAKVSPGKSLRSVNLQTLKKIKVFGSGYKIK